MEYKYVEETPKGYGLYVAPNGVGGVCIATDGCAVLVNYFDSAIHDLEDMKYIVDNFKRLESLIES